MPSKTALTPAQWREKLLAVLPPWILEDIEESVISAHLAGAAAVLSQCEADAYAQVDETFIERCSEETLLAHMHERLIPDLSYAGEGLRRQIQRMWNRLHIREIAIVVNDLLTEDTADIEPGVSLAGHSVIDIDYEDNGSVVVDMATQPNLFNVIINAIAAVYFDYCNRDAYVGFATAGYSSEGATEDLAKRIAAALDFYKASGVRYRISKRT